MNFIGKYWTTVNYIKLDWTKLNFDLHWIVSNCFDCIQLHKLHIKLYCTILNFIKVVQYIQLYIAASNCISLYQTVLNWTSWTVLDSIETVWDSIETVWDSIQTVLNYILNNSTTELYWNVFNCFKLYYTLLYWIEHSWTESHDIILYLTVLNCFKLN